MDIKNFTAAIAQIAEEKGLNPEKVLETIEMAIAAAYKKDYGKKGQIIKAKLDPKLGEVKFWQEKLVVDKKMIYTEEELEKMKALSPEAKASEGEKPSSAEDMAGEGKVRFNPEKHITTSKRLRPNRCPNSKASNYAKNQRSRKREYFR